MTGPDGNHPPSIATASLKLENENNLDVIRVLPVGIDKDGDPVSFSCEWTRNGTIVGNGESLSEFKRGDSLSVKITPYDGKAYGRPKTVVTEILNTCPKVIGHSEFVFDGAVFSTRINATDPDGDSITYSIASAPAGVTVDADSGLLRWAVPPDFTGRQEVTVKISDGAGGELIYTLPIEILKTADVPNAKAL